MIRKICTFLVVGFALAACGGPSGSGSGSASYSGGFNSAIRGLDHQEGFFDIYVDQTSGRILAALPTEGEDGVALSMIYATGITAGLGSNPIGLDRGAFDGGVVLHFRKVGDRIIAEQENTRYRATSGRPLEEKAVEESFARSFLWSAQVIAAAEDGRLLVDLSDFLTRDHFGIVDQIERNDNGGAYQLAEDRSFPDTGAALAFPDNVELDAFLTLTSTDPGSEPRATAPDARDVTLVQHHSFIRLPPPGYKPRKADQRSGAITVSYYDFSSPLDEPIVTELARRFRLEREDPTATSGPVKDPIIFYVDSGAPEEIQQALIEGASWWAEAFEAAGFEDAYKVELLPEGEHPFDVRYNMIQWTHRQTRGWSYGGGVADPRTGEMLKANVILGSQRVRQDRMIFEGLAGAEKSGTGDPDDPVQIALARIRQLSAHEVGHTLGFAHNFAASSNDRASVMDYPAPYVRPDGDNGLDFSEAYAVGIGAWDIAATKWLYSEFREGVDEVAALDAILDDAYNTQGLRFVADSEARSPGTAHPYAAVWDNGGDATSALDETMRVRQIALSNFGTGAVKPDRPQSALNAVIVPIYLYHRYQVAAAAKLVGGLEFGYGYAGDTAGTRAIPVSPARQRAALNAISRTVGPAALDLPNEVLIRLTPQINGGYLGGETFSGRAGPVFDLLTAADVAADLSISALLLHPERVARLIEFHRRDETALSFDEVLNAIEDVAFAPVAEGRQQEIAHIVQTRFASALMALSVNPSAPSAVKAKAEVRLYAIRDRLSRARGDHAIWLADRINAHQVRDAVDAMDALPGSALPPGSPIGQGPAYETCWHCE